ncbi:MAG: hypothetical protein JNL21_04740 [Myxococcales bacterium]|nr:hypothetical protein [Myxococcales bacterium]
MSPAAVLAGLRIGAARLTRGRALAAALTSIAVTIVIAVIERGSTPVGAADRALATVFRLVVPLCAVALSGQSTGLVSLRDAAWPASRFGHPRASVGLGLALAATIATALLSLLTAILALLATRIGAEAGRAALPLARDLMTTSWIAVLAGAAYAAWVGLGATWGRRGGGRLVVLAVDLVAGGLSGAGAVLPRGLTRHLLGGEAPLELPQAASSAILLGTTLACLGLVTLRTRD